jgi:hypothetical protein
MGIERKEKKKKTKIMRKYAQERDKELPAMKQITAVRKRRAWCQNIK